MNEILNNIKTRRSIRSFTDEKIPKEALEQIVEAGRYAPSAMQSSALPVYGSAKSCYDRKLSCSNRSGVESWQQL